MSFSSAVTQWDQYTVPDAQADGVDPNLARAIMTAESGGQQFASDGSVLTSKTGALGLMQLEPGTAAGLGVNPADPAANIKGGVAYIAQLLARFGGNQDKAIAAYNAGPNAVERYNGIPPYAETQKYVANVDALLAANGTPTPTPGGSSTPAGSGTIGGVRIGPWEWLPDPNTLGGKAGAAVGGAATKVAGTTADAATGVFAPVISAAQSIAIEVTIGAVFLAIVAGGFALAASDAGPTVSAKL